MQIQRFLSKIFAPWLRSGWVQMDPLSLVPTGPLLHGSLRRIAGVCMIAAVFLLAILGCRAVTGFYPVEPAIAPRQTATSLEYTPPPVQEVTLGPDTVTPTATQQLSETATPNLPTKPGATPFRVQVHPEGGLFVGDRVSFEVIAPPGEDYSQSRVQVAVAGEEPFAEAGFAPFGIAQRTQATLFWAWDTRSLTSGEYVLVFTIEPGGFQWSESFTLLPAEALPPDEAGVTWARATNMCCTVYYMTNTAAERDLNGLLEEIDRQAQHISQILPVEDPEPVTITLLPRLLGHGGFANGEIHVSYLDRNYAGGLPAMVIHHELVHIQDASLGGEYIPTLLVEGLAVYLSGGHFKPEPLMPRAAALLDAWGEPERPGLGWYLPLQPLADHFYQSQHEIGYLQAGALVEFMVQTWGWDAFARFYGNIPERSSPSQALDAALRQHFGLSLEALEARFIEALRRQFYDARLQADIRLTVQYYDTVRRYQQALDPSAYFVTAWLLDTKQMRQENLVADYLRHPEAPANLILELILANAGQALVEGRLPQAEQYITAANAVLDALEEGWGDPFSASLISTDFAAVLQALQSHSDWVGVFPEGWFKVQRLWIEEGQARIWVTGDSPRLQEVRLARDAQGAWQFLSAAFK